MSTTEAINENKNRTFLDTLKDSVAVLGGITVILTVLTWYLGRRFGRGYFYALNIPFFQVEFSTWEYGEVSRLSLLIGLGMIGVVLAILLSVIKSERSVFRRASRRIRLILIIAGGLLTSAVVYFVSNDIIQILILLLFFLLLLATDLGQHYSEKPHADTKVRNYLFKTYTVYLVVCLVILFSNFLAILSYEHGKASGKSFLDETLSVRLTLDKPLIDKPLIDKPLIDNVPDKSNVSANNETLYVFDGLRLLLYNNRRYYLFREVGFDCKPKQVYVISEEHVQSIVYTPVPQSQSNCVAAPAPSQR